MKNKIVSRFLFVFVTVFLISLPFPHPYIPDIPAFLQPFFESLVKWTGSAVFHIRRPYTSSLVSDSTGLYIHTFNCSIIAGLAAICWSTLSRSKNGNPRLFYWFRIAVSYYLALQLFEYGFSKLFKWQFYLPEPNTLYTTLGDIPRDLAYWSTMGLSRPYTVIAGAVEILAAAMLLFKRTRLTGALLAFIVLTNVVAINFCYDISVKILSCFLLLQSIIIITPDWHRITALFFKAKKEPVNNNETVYALPEAKFIHPFIKVSVIAYMLFSTLSVYFTENNFNDDKAPRPAFHGAWDVVLFVKNSDTLQPLLTDTTMWRRVFVHRRGYFITQDMGDHMQDYALVTDTITHHFLIENEYNGLQFNLAYKQYPDHTLSLSGIFGEDSLWLKLRPTDMKKLPALQNEFNWTIDN